MILYYMIPIFIHLLLAPFWYILQDCTVLSLIELVFGTFVSPLYLVFISYKTISEFEFIKFIKYLALIIFISDLSISIEYINWGISTGRFWTPDVETIFIKKLEMILSNIISTVGLSTIQIIKTIDK